MDEQPLEDHPAKAIPGAAPVEGDVADLVRTEPWPRRVRGVLHHHVVVDSTDAVLQFEEGHLPVWYFPEDAVRLDLLEPSPKHTDCPHKGTASYWHIRVGDDLVKDAAWSYRDLIPERDDLR